MAQLKGLCSQDLLGSYRNSKGFTQSEGVKWEWGRENWRFFRPISRRISETVQDRSRLLSMSNNTSHTRFRLVPKSMTLDNLGRSLRTTCFSEPTTTIWMKIAPCHQQQKCSSANLDSGNIRFLCGYSRDYLEKGRQTTVGLSTTAIVSALAGYVFGNLR